MIVAVALQPGLIPRVQARALAAACEGVVAKLRLVDLGHLVLVATLVLIRILRLRLVQLLLKRLQIERRLL